MGNTSDTISQKEVDHGCYKSKKFEYKWTIKNFKKNVGIGTTLSSEFLSAPYENNKNTFNLKLHPHGYNERVKDYLSVYLKRYESHEILIQFSCSILDSKGKEINTKSIKQKMSVETHLGWQLYYRRDIIFNDEKKILADGNLILHCTFEIFENKAIIDAVTEDNDPSMNRSLSKMSTDMIQLLVEGEFSDVTIKVEDQEFPVHKAILSTRSAVFKTMMKSELAINSKEIIINNISTDVVKKMLHYIYSGNFVFTDVQMTQELYVAAVYYELYDLIDICKKMLVNNLNTKNSIDILLLGHERTDNDLIVACVDFIAKNISEIRKINQWMTFMENYPKLADMVFNTHLKKSSV